MARAPQAVYGNVLTLEDHIMKHLSMLLFICSIGASATWAQSANSQGTKEDERSIRVALLRVSFVHQDA